MSRKLAFLLGAIAGLSVGAVTYAALVYRLFRRIGDMSGVQAPEPKRGGTKA